LKVKNSREFPREFENSGIPGIPVREFPVALILTVATVYENCPIFDEVIRRTKQCAKF